VREVSTDVTLCWDGSGTFDCHETVRGSLAPMVVETWYSNCKRHKSEPVCAQHLCDQLIKSDFFGLKSDPDPQKPGDYTEILNVIKGKKVIKTLTFTTTPQSAQRLALKNAMLEFAKCAKLDQGPFDWSLVSRTEGDGITPRKVELKDLLTHPVDYDSKRVSVRGYYRWEFEGSSFGADKGSVIDREYSKCLWIDEPSSFAHVLSPEMVMGAWVRIDGVFRKGPAGHLGGWPGELDRITRLDFEWPFW
jgi:hypothetical protein